MRAGAGQAVPVTSRENRSLGVIVLSSVPHMLWRFASSCLGECVCAREGLLVLHTGAKLCRGMFPVDAV